MNKLVKNTGLLLVGGLSLTSCGKKELIEENSLLRLEINELNAQLRGVWVKLLNANQQIEDNLIKIGELEINVDELTSANNDLIVKNETLNTLIEQLYAEIDALNATILEYNNEINRIQTLLDIEEQKSVANNDVIDQLTEELDEMTAKYDHLVNNPVVIVETRFEVLESIIQVEGTISTETANELYDTLATTLEDQGDVTANTLDISQAIAQLTAAHTIATSNLEDLEAVLITLELNSPEWVAVRDANNAMRLIIRFIDGALVKLRS